MGRRKKRVLSDDGRKVMVAHMKNLHAKRKARRDAALAANPNLLSFEQVAKLQDVAQMTVYGWLRRGLKVTVVDGIKLIDIGELERFIAERKGGDASTQNLRRNAEIARAAKDQKIKALLSDGWLSVEQIESLYGIPPYVIYKWAKQGLCSVKVYGCIVFEERELAIWMAREMLSSGKIPQFFARVQAAN